MMPSVNGIELLGMVKKKLPDLAVIMATAVDDRKTAVEAMRLGAYGYIIKPFYLNEFLINIENAIERGRLHRENKMYTELMGTRVLEKTADIRNREEEIALRLTSAAGYRDEETGEHIKRIGLYSAVMAENIGLSHEEVSNIKAAAPMHDVGKIGIPDHVLRKPGDLSPDEFEMIKEHPKIGACILGGSKIPLLKVATDIALYHHEKWDGSGYPAGLSGKDIPLAARIVAVADVYDALSNDRVYRSLYPKEEVFQIMKEKRGTHFDPEIYDCFLDCLLEINRHLENNRDTSCDCTSTVARIMRHNPVLAS
jgi:putative two-component system response regulator